jgi:hypothetical protein
VICAGNYTPISAGANVVELCYDYFEPPRDSAPRPPAFALHVAGISSEHQTAAFALIPPDPTRPSQWFLARWGRTGTGPVAFMPIPQQVEDDRPAVVTYGHKFSNFNWRNCQWEITEVVAPRAVEMPSAWGGLIELPANGGPAYAFRDGTPVVNVDALEAGEHDGILKEPEPQSPSFLVHYGGRIWRRWSSPDHEPPLELLAFDPASPQLASALDEVWSGIGGQEEAKRELVRAIQWPVLYPELFVLFKRRRSRGVLLYGPPGCGKTLLGKAVVHLLAALYRRRAEDGGFKYVKGHQLLDQYVGNSEKAVKALFDDARRWREQKGYPAVLFFDEADALFKRRPAREGGFTLVPALLAEMDGMDDSGAFVMLATNRPDALDEAVMRPGRIDRRIRITRPEEAAATTIFRIHLEGVFAEEPVESLAAGAARELFRDDHVLYDVEFEDGSTDRFRLRDLASGALAQNIVDRATANKMEYCIERGVKTGLTAADLAQAVAEVLAEQRESRHADELADFAERRGARIAAVTRAAGSR